MVSRHVRRLLLVCLVVSVGFAEAADDAVVDYVREVKPLLAARCFTCHGALAQKGKLRLDTVSLMRKGGESGSVLEPGQADQSRLLLALRGENGLTRMPPESEGEPLKPEEIDRIRRWINQGAKAPVDEQPEKDPREHWAFQRPERHTPPRTESAANNPIDAWLSVEHRRLGVTPQPEADRRLLLRRVSLDLIGLPPTPEQIHEFLTDESPDAFERVVDRLLASPQYGERWGRHFMDIWRYSDWYGRRHVPDVWNSAPQIWRWRDWIVRSLNQDHGYDRMIREMLAADEICPTDDEAAVATGYLIRNWYALNPNDWMRNTVEHTGKAFLGLTFHCAHCHDHKYDPISQENYFQLRAFFEPISVRQDRVPGEADPGPFQEYNYSTLRKIQRLGAVRIFDKTPDAPTWFYIGGDERNRQKERGPISPGIPAFLGSTPMAVEPRSLPVEAWYPGFRPAIQETIRSEIKTAISKAESEISAATQATEARSARLAAAASRLIAARTELASIEARIAADRAKFGQVANVDVSALARSASRLERDAALRKAEADVLAHESALAIAEAKPMSDANRAKEIDTANKLLTTARSVLDKTRAAAADMTSEVYSPLSPVYPRTSTGRRSALARWMTHRDNPLTARVAVNHIWARHFHIPLVSSVTDFGRNGAAPTHPEILASLAVEFMESGWSLKSLHRRIVTSAAYRRVSGEKRVGSEEQNGVASNSTLSTPHSALAADPENKSLWRMNAGRMEAEVLRDSLLYVAGKLEPKIGGQELENSDALTTFRRSLYYSVYPEQGGQSAMGELFDAPNPLDCYRRTKSIVPQQALALTNSDLVHRVGAAIAESMTEPTAEPFIRAVFERILSRPPTPAEAATCSQYLTNSTDARRRESLVRALLNHNDFVTIR